MKNTESGSVLNMNVGILGHVDSGKTTLARALSDIASTAAFDKNPQSQKRGITIDLGFSALLLDFPCHLNDCASDDFDKLQFTFVDCPGHASLIRTIIGGAQIVHMIILVVDITKGMQTQTAECLVIAEILCKHLIVVLNKTDLLPSEKKMNLIDKMKKRFHLTLADTNFKNAPLVALSASESSEGERCSGLNELIECLKNMVFVPKHQENKPFVLAVDHCFNIHGHGTIMTGTVLQGRVSIKDVVEVPSVAVKAKVKSMQMFRRPVQRADEGDRVGICIAQMDSKVLERGLICTPGYITPISAALICVNHIKYFKGLIKSSSKFHISVAHETVIGSITIFRALSTSDKSDSFDFEKDYIYEEELPKTADNYFMLIKFEKPVLTMPDALIIGSRLEMDVNGMACRLAFWGKIVHSICTKNLEEYLGSHLKVYIPKRRKGILERIVQDDVVIVRDLIKKETNPEPFIGLQVELSSGERGNIMSTFGKRGKLNVHIPGGLKVETLMAHHKIGGKKGTGKGDETEVTLLFKRYIFDSNKKMFQDL